MTYEQLKELLAEGDFSKIKKVLTSQKKDVNIDDLKKQWSVKDHDVCSTTIRPNRTVNYEDPSGEVDSKGEPIMHQRQEDVARIPVPFQKTIVGKAVSFLFGNPVSITAQTKSENEQKAVESLVRILDDNKADSRNREVARQLFRSTEVAEIWYPIEMDLHDDYGFSTTKRLRMSVFSPWDGSSLYPFFDEFGDMIAFSREFTVKDQESKDVQHFDIYTADQVIKWTKNAGQTGSDWTLDSTSVNIIGKIPVVYASQEQAEWEDVQFAIDRLETLISNHADTNDYNGSPTVVATGTILSMGKKGEQGKVLELDQGGKVEYLSWDHAPESIKLEIENLFRIIYSFTQTPDISFEAVRSISSISGIALKLLFMDAHLKVMDKREIFDPYLARRVNIIKAFLTKLDTKGAAAYSKLRVNTEIKPFIIEDVKERMDTLLAASGGKAVISQRTAIGQAGLVESTEDEYKLLQAEFARENSFSVTEPHI